MEPPADQPPDAASLPLPPDRRGVLRPYRERANRRIDRLQTRARELGPGLITGAADDDPSGIATYSQAGAAFGYSTLWIALLTLPLMAAVQLMCARIGIVTRSGLANVLRAHYPRWVLWGACSLLVLGNTVNIAADLGGMAAAASLLTGIAASWFVPAFTALIMALLVFASYEKMTRVLKWLSLALFSYVFAAVLAKPNALAALRGTFTPRVVWSKEYVLMLVAILGTTISPYLFFWQAAQNAEQDAHWREQGKKAERPQRALQRELRAAARDVNTGMLFSNAIMFFIILTAAATLYRNGLRDVATAEQAAEALRPLAGRLGVAVCSRRDSSEPACWRSRCLAGSAAYAVAGAASWRAGMDENVHTAKHFYSVMSVAMAVGTTLSVVHAKPIQLLIWAAVINGLLAPPLILLILAVTNNPAVMGGHRNGRGLNVLGGIAGILMTGAGVALVWSWLV